MNDTIFKIYFRLLALALAAVALAAGPSLAASVTLNLKAEARPVTMPDPDGAGPLTGQVITMWGFFDSADAGTQWKPFDMPVKPVEGDDLTINLTNNLPVPVSIVIPGQSKQLTPVPLPSDPLRVRSFDVETGPGEGPVAYTWTNLKPGSFLIQSGTHPALQVPMGLYFALAVDVAQGEAYPGLFYDSEVVLLYSEIDPAQHATAVGATPLTYKPKYFLINGKPFDPLAPTPPLDAGGVGETLLIRMLNAGLKSHSPMLYNGGYMDLVAEDGNPYPYAREQYSAHLAPGKTIDALWVPGAEAVYPLFDRMHHLTSGGFGKGGMLARLQVGAGTASDTVAILRTRYLTAGELRVWADSSAAPGAVLTLTGYGLMPYIGNVDFDYRLFARGVAANPGTAGVTSDQGGSDSKPVPYTAPPVAFADAYSVNEGGTLIQPAAGVLANDTRGGYFLAADSLRASLVTAPGNGALTLNADGGFTYIHNGSETLFDTFTYVARAVNTTNNTVQATSNEVVATITITPQNDPPTSVNDSASTDDNTPAVINVLANDTDADGDALRVNTFSQGTSGTVTCDTAAPGGTCTYTPTVTGEYVDTFTYSATDGTGVGNTATVTVTVTAGANQSPVAVDDFATTRACNNTTVPCVTRAITINVVGNDSDPDGAIAPATVCVRFNDCLNPAPRLSKNGGLVTNNYNGTITYQPPPGYLGTDLFKYSVEDDDGAVSNRANVRVNVRQ
ncbi:Ig-like domain-containing protein [Desulfococcus sp.]|uniref:Ig-like domain-containing protein n=1 Tax=Desulfococcus sp. TaxID=2025834 RepID=UPI00359364EF